MMGKVLVNGSSLALLDLSALRRGSTPASLSDQVPAGSPSSPATVVSFADLADLVELTPKLIETIERLQNGKK